MSATTAAALFETNFIILPSFSLNLAKSPVIIKAQRGIRDEIGLMCGSGLSKSFQKIPFKKSGGLAPSTGRFYDFSMKMTYF